MHQSVATIDSPEFLNLQPLDINPLMSKCEIKILYVGENRNHTFITEEVAAQIGKTLRGAPIVGYYKDKKEDFADHGEKIIIDDEGIKFQCQTFPYGFISPDSKVWFQTFEDTDANGDIVTHKYLMATGYLWTDQFPESSLPVEQGRPQSMEFKKQSVKGRWETNLTTGIDFFIINDAIIQKICILGDDVEPCFQGASVTAPDISTHFTLDNKFKNTLYNMMQDLKDALKGGQQMENLENATLENKEVNAYTKEDASVDKDKIEDTSVPADYVKKEDQEEKKKEEKASENEENGSKEEESNQSGGNTSQEKKDEEEKQPEEKEEDDEKKKSAKKYSAIEQQLNILKEQYSTLQTQYQELVNFKREIDNQKKDALIAEFYMLSEEDKKDVIKNKQKYTLDEIKSKLAVICFDKKINFTLNKEEENKEEVISTYNLKEQNSTLPDWVKAVKEQEKLN